MTKPWSEAFERAFAETIGHELFPGFSNKSSDKGRLTVAGITYRDNPDWLGWAVLDTALKELGLSRDTTLDCHPSLVRRIDAKLAENKSLLALVKLRYHDGYWLPLNLDNDPFAAAKKVFDTCVNMGPKPALAAMRGARDRILAEHQRLGLGDV